MWSIENELVDLPEDQIDFSVAASAIPPSFDDSVVVSMDEEVGASLALSDE